MRVGLRVSDDPRTLAHVNDLSLLSPVSRTTAERLRKQFEWSLLRADRIDILRGHYGTVLPRFLRSVAQPLM